jgi:hypothetical protein
MKKLLAPAAIALALGLGLSSAAMAGNPTAVVCNDESVSSLSGFNDVANCPAAKTATGGGYQLTSAATGDLLGVAVNENMPVLGGTGGTQPIGWEVVGTNLTTIPGKIRVCVLCRF